MTRKPVIHSLEEFRGVVRKTTRILISKRQKAFKEHKKQQEQRRNAANELKFNLKGQHKPSL